MHAQQYWPRLFGRVTKFADMCCHFAFFGGHTPCFHPCQAMTSKRTDISRHGEGDRPASWHNNMPHAKPLCK